MLVTDFIRKLNTIKKKHKDIEVFLVGDEFPTIPKIQYVMLAYVHSHSKLKGYVLESECYSSSQVETQQLVDVEPIIVIG